MSGEKIEQLAARVVALDDRVADVRPVEAGDEDPRPGETQPLDDLSARRAIGGGCQGDPRHRRVTLVQHRELHVLGPEVVAPLRHAVGFVDGKEGDRAGAGESVEEAQEAPGQQPFRRHVEQVELATEQPRLSLRSAGGIERGVEIGGAHAGLEQCVDLVLHQRDQRRDDDAAALAQQRRNLVAERLAAAGRHQHQGVAAGGDMADDLGLGAAKGGVAEDRTEQGQRRGAGR